MSQGRTREEARDNVLDALRTVLTPDKELARQTHSPTTSTCDLERHPRSHGCREIGGLQARQVARAGGQVSACRDIRRSALGSQGRSASNSAFPISEPPLVQRDQQ